MRLLVVGAGEMGRWFAETLADTAEEIVFADRDSDTAEAAAETVGGRAVATDTDESFDAVCIAVPLPAAADAIETHADRAERAIVDVAGVMAEPIAAMRAAAPDLERVSLHPLFAAANAPGNVAVVADAPGPVTDEIRGTLTAAGNDLFETTPADHDESMETVQARAHAAVLAYGLAAKDVHEEFQTPVSAALADLVEQVTDGDPRVYADVQAAFEGADAVAAAAEELADADHEQFQRLYREAGR